MPELSIFLPTPLLSPLAGVLQIPAQLPDSIGVERLRLRLSGNHYFADLTVGMPRNLSFQRTEQMKEQVADAVRLILPEADVVVNVVPRIGRSESIFDRVRAVAARHNLSVHDLSVQHYDGKLHLEQHLEVPESLSLREAHTLVTRIESETRADVPEIDSILTHIESERGTIELKRGAVKTPHSKLNCAAWPASFRIFWMYTRSLYRRPANACRFPAIALCQTTEAWPMFTL